MSFNRSASPDPPQYSLDPIRFRSVSERTLADSILSREGQWDASAQCFLTKERLLQELTRKFVTLGTLLRHNPALQYATQGNDLDCVYPKCPKLLMKHHTVNNSQLSLEDPTRQNIEYRRQIAARNQALREREQEGATSLLHDGKESVEWIERLEREFAQQAKGQKYQQNSGAKSQLASSIRKDNSKILLHNSSMNQSSVRDADTSGVSVNDSTAATGGASSAAKPSAHDFPRIGGDAKRHSSLLMQLKKSRAPLSQQQQDTSIVRSILAMDASATLKHTITRMFADPKNADNISKEEYERREKEYAEERARAASYQNDLVRDEREMIERELAHFKA